MNIDGRKGQRLIITPYSYYGAIFMRTLLAFLLLYSGSAAAIPILWDISFFDKSSHALVGSGQFSYDPATETTVRGGPFNEPLVTVNTAITQLDWSVQGHQWSENDASVLWWADDIAEPHPPGHLGRQRGPSFVAYNRWFLGDSFRGTKQFVLNFDHADSTSGAGSWIQAVAPGHAPHLGSLAGFSSGFWHATPHVTVVPIPTTLPLFGLGLAGLFWVAQRQRRPHIGNESAAL